MLLQNTSTLIRRLSFLAVVAVLISGYISQAHAQDVTLTCKFVDAVTGAEVKTVSPGGKVLALLQVSVPDVAAGAFIGISTSAKLSFAGIDIPYKIPTTDLTGANTDPETGNAGLQNGMLKKEIRVPAFVRPGSALKIVAQATVLNLTSNVCKLKLKVQ